MNKSDLVGWINQCMSGRNYGWDKTSTKGLLQLIKTNIVYTPDLWAPDQHTPIGLFHQMLRNDFGQWAVVWEEIKALPQDIQHNIFNTPTPDGKVLLHDAWKLISKEGSTTTSAEKADLILTCVTQTHEGQWTWLDSSSCSPGDGWKKAILQLQAHQSSPFFTQLMQKIEERLPSVKTQDPSSSPWLSVETPTQVETLLTTGYSLEDTVRVNERDFVAWEFLLLVHGPWFFRNSLQTRLSGVGQTSVEEMEANTAQWKYLAPSDRRSKIGYVKQVLEKLEGDFKGQTSLHYLLKHRPDLLALCNQQMLYTSNQSAFEIFAQPDKMGYTILTQSVLSSWLSPVLALFKSLNLPVKWGFEGKGWFAHEQFIKRWFEGSPTGMGFSGVGIDKVQTLLKETNNPELVFGDETQQQKWVEEWDRLLPLLPKLSQYKTAERNSYSYGSSNKSKDEHLPLLCQALLFVSSQGQLDGLNPQLKNQLRVAGLWCCAMPGLMQNWMFRNVKDIRHNESSPPEIVTPGIEAFCENGGVKQIFPSLAAEPITEQWAARLQHHRVSQSLDTSGANGTKRKM